mgnify:CR=1 FL=1
MTLIHHTIAATDPWQPFGKGKKSPVPESDTAGFIILGLCFIIVLAKQLNRYLRR